MGTSRRMVSSSGVDESAAVGDQRSNLELGLLLENDPDDVEDPDESGRTRLHRAIDIGAHEAVGVLLSAGADVNAQDHWGNTPLFRAVYHHRAGGRIVDMLINHHADPSVANHHDATALDLAQSLADVDTAVAGLLPVLRAERVPPPRASGNGD